MNIMGISHRPDRLWGNGPHASVSVDLRPESQPFRGA